MIAPLGRMGKRKQANGLRSGGRLATKAVQVLLSQMKEYL